MKQPKAAPIVAAGTAAAGLGALLFALFGVVDCLRFQTKPGQCNEVVRENATILAMGLLGVAGPLSGYFTLNPMLGTLDPERIRKAASAIGATGVADAVIEQIATSRLGGSGSVDVERVLMMHARGLANKHIARAVGASESDVAAALRANDDLEPGL